MSLRKDNLTIGKWVMVMSYDKVHVVNIHYNVYQSYTSRLSRNTLQMLKKIKEMYHMTHQL